MNAVALRDIDLEMKNYVGPVSPDIPASFKFNVLPLKVCALWLFTCEMQTNQMLSSYNDVHSKIDL